jgi:hypothetical protein
LIRTQTDSLRRWHRQLRKPKWPNESSSASPEGKLPQRGWNVPREVCSNQRQLDSRSGFRISDWLRGLLRFFDFLTKVALNVWGDEEEIEQKDEGEA